VAPRHKPLGLFELLGLVGLLVVSGLLKLLWLLEFKVTAVNRIILRVLG
jgi:hypothetical protein